MLLLRALISVAVLPGFFAGFLPWFIAKRDPWRVEGSDWGTLLLGAGIGLLVLCVRDFLVIGRGTLAPWDPPRKLVVVGLYRYTRNPMYVAVFLILTGTAIVTGSPVVLAYMVVAMLIVHIRVLTYEEPILTKLFGDDYLAYKRQVNRWWPRVSAPAGAPPRSTPGAPES
jgi:protein-S-isoprenylcysteine O-methyltransferase Ste14